MKKVKILVLLITLSISTMLYAQGNYVPGYIITNQQDTVVGWINFRTDNNNQKQQEIFDIVLEAQKTAIDGVKPGIKSCEIDKIARSIITEYGYGDNFIHSTGHSLGLDVHENPSISKKDETILEENMVITIEPGIYLKGEFGVRIEDTVIVGKNKGEIIGNLPYDI